MVVELLLPLILSFHIFGGSGTAEQLLYVYISAQFIVLQIYYHINLEDNKLLMVKNNSGLATVF